MSRIPDSGEKLEFNIDKVNAGDERRIGQPLIPYSPDFGLRKDLPHKYGKMDALGCWQFDYIKQCGLKPHHRVLEIGPGGFRLAQHLVPYMERSHYYAAEVSRQALDWGWQLLTDEERTMSPQLFWGGDFSFATIGASFDFVWAHSVFTHLTWNEIGKCLYELHSTIAQDGIFLATYFRVENILWQPHAYGRSKSVDKRKSSYGHKDPFHYSFDVINDLARRTGWSVSHLDLPDHPKSQSMLRFTLN